MQTTARTEYHNARRMLRDNGRYALRWLPLATAQAMRDLLNAPGDILAERAQLLRDFGTLGAQQDVRYRSGRTNRRSF